ncbi:PAS domain-containing sensor histidine kinase [Bacteroidota bacterium]
MVYNKLYIGLLIHVLVMLGLCIVFAFNLLKQDFFYVIISLAGLVLTIVILINWLNRTNRKLALFFKSVKNDDSSFSFPEQSQFKNERLLNENLNIFNQKLQKTKMNLEIQKELLKVIIENVKTGIFSIDTNGKIDFRNSALLNMLKLQNLTNIKQINNISPEFTRLIIDIKPGEAEHFKLNSENNLLSLSIQAENIKFENKNIKIVTIHDIRKELEHKELDSWQKLFRIMNHEITNSIVPISSLSNSISEYFVKDGEAIKLNLINDNTIKKTLKGLGVIEEHSQSLLKIIESYRNLTKLPVPEIKEFNLKDLFERILILAPGFNNNSDSGMPKIKLDINSEELTILADEDLIGQVLINLVKNAMECFENNQKDKLIVLSAQKNKDGQIFIRVQDNGPGMDQEISDNIFIPFFTTKKNGSGIGLPLSRQILRLHNASIHVNTQIGAGTVFNLIF